LVTKVVLRLEFLKGSAKNALPFPQM
jgi:hypothetical protein